MSTKAESWMYLLKVALVSWRTVVFVATPFVLLPILIANSSSVSANCQTLLCSSIANRRGLWLNCYVTTATIGLIAVLLVLL